MFPYLSICMAMSFALAKPGPADLERLRSAIQDEAKRPIPKIELRLGQLEPGTPAAWDGRVMSVDWSQIEALAAASGSTRSDVFDCVSASEIAMLTAFEAAGRDPVDDDAETARRLVISAQANRITKRVCEPRVWAQLSQQFGWTVSWADSYLRTHAATVEAGYAVLASPPTRTLDVLGWDWRPEVCPDLRAAWSRATQQMATELPFFWTSIAGRADPPVCANGILTDTNGLVFWFRYPSAEIADRVITQETPARIEGIPVPLPDGANGYRNGSSKGPQWIIQAGPCELMIEGGGGKWLESFIADVLHSCSS